MDDDQLWARAREGDADAFEALFRRHARDIYNYCFRQLGDWDGAEDMLSIVFLHAWRKRGTAVEAGKLLPWLYGIATNTCRNRRRSQRRYAAALRRLPPPAPERDFADDADERLRDELEAAKLLRFIDTLPARERDVLILCGWSGVSYADAAVSLQVNVGTIRSRLSRARVRVRELHQLNGHEETTQAAEPEGLNP